MVACVVACVDFRSVVWEASRARMGSTKPLLVETARSRRWNENARFGMDEFPHDCRAQRGRACTMDPPLHMTLQASHLTRALPFTWTCSFSSPTFLSCIFLDCLCHRVRLVAVYVSFQLVLFRVAWPCSTRRRRGRALVGITSVSLLVYDVDVDVVEAHVGRACAS